MAGDYISREAALADFESCNAEKPNWTPQRVKTLLLRQPAADAAEVVHGKWDGNDCTVCKLPWNYNMVQDADEWGYFDPMPEYCPNCGAKMDGGNDDG